MVLIDTVAGVAFGVTLRLFSNNFQGQRYLWRPWNFLIFGAAFGYVGSKLESFQHNLLEELNVRNKEAGFPEIKREELSAWNTLSTHYDNTENEVLEQGKKNRA